MEGSPVLHVLVIGFHHKKGCQVEFSYPPLTEGSTVESNELPEEWKHIPSLALPDGAHNFDKDTVYFVLPGRKDNPSTVYGVSCYRQMNANDLINRTADVTRSTVQKSVCVLSRLPLFGLINAKLELITHAYFDERDFSQVAVLEQTFNNLNSSLTESLLEGSQVFLGLPVRDLVALYKHKIIILFKLIMLERRVLFFGSPVETLCHTVLGILSLFPGMIESGLMQACNQWNEKKLSPTLALTNFNSDLDEDEEFLEVRYHNSTPDSPLTEVMSHMHNSALNLGASGDTDYSSLNIHYEDASKQTVNANEPPESPSILRDPTAFDKQTKATDLLSHYIEAGKRKQLENVTTNSKQESELIMKDTSHFEQFKSQSFSSPDSNKLTVHVLPKTKKTPEINSINENIYNVKHPCDYIPQADTDKTVLQSGIILSNILDIDSTFQKIDESDFIEANLIDQHGNLTLHTTIQRPTSKELIEDLDSPESISKIDKEDCFSWEQDRLQLSIEHDHTPEVLDNASSGTLASSKSASRDSIAISDKESASSDSTTASSTQLDKLKNNTLTLRTTNSDPESNSLNLKEKKSKVFKNKLNAALGKVGQKTKTKSSMDDLLTTLTGQVMLNQDQIGYPLAIFTKGTVCYPYLSLQYHDILTDVNTRSFVIGATNILFKQKRQFIDVIIEVADGKVDIRDKELQRHLSLTTADLRFADYLVKTVTEEKFGYLDGTEWEGSDEWIRAQFKYYINSLLSTIVADDSKALDDFGSAFIAAWKTTHNFKYWQENEHPGLSDIPTGHPFQGNMSISDVRVRFNHTLQNTERGRKINAAVVQTGKYVVQTGKAVGGAISSAKSAVTGWFSSWRHNDKPSPEESQKTTEVKNSGDTADS